MILDIVLPGKRNWEVIMLKLALTASAAVAVLTAAGAASAAINVSIWVDQAGAAGNATLAQAGALGAPSATTSVNALNFSTGDSDVTTIDQFLGASLGGAVGGHALNNTYFLFTGSTFLHAGSNSFVVPHDDGLQLNIDGIGLVVDQPGPTGEVDTPFDVIAPSDGIYNFELAYGECCGGPAVIRFDVNGQPAGGVPEPAMWALMLAGFGLVGATLRSRRREQLAA
jgi:hypothetical protein